MTTEKPSRNEDEYFAREDAERLRKMREQEAADQDAAERKSHFMRCPKCGGTLFTESYHGIQVDRCPDCHGVWFDAGEVEGLLKDEGSGILQRVMTDVRTSLRKLRPSS